MALVQKWLFFKLFFRQYRPGKCLLRYFRTRKRLSRLSKIEVRKVEKLTFFPKGLTDGFGRKMAIFASFFIRHSRPLKCLLRYFRTKKRLSRLWKIEVQEVEKLTFFQRGEPIVMVQKWPFFQLFFFKQCRQGKCLLQYSSRKKRLCRL